MAREPVDVTTYRHADHAKDKWVGPPDHPSDLGESETAHFEYQLRPDEFCVPPADSQGQTVQIQVRLQPQMLRVITSIRDSPNSPYRTIGDVVRHAIHRHARWYYAIHKKLSPTYLSVLKISVEATRDKVMLSETEGHGKIIGERIKLLLSEGEREEARVELIRCKQLFEALPPGPHRRRVLAWLYENYREILHS